MKKLNNSLKVFLPKAILFDTDNTLYEYEPANDIAIRAVYQKINKIFGLSYKKFKNYYEISRKEIKDQLGNTASSHSRLIYFQRMLEKIGCSGKIMLALDLEQTFWRTFLANATLFDGLIEFIEDIKKKGIPICIVTDLTSHIQLRKLTYFNFEDTFDAVVCSEEVGFDKPNIVNFQLAIAKLGLKDTNDIWMIGDNSETDIIGGKKSGLITFQKIHKGVMQGKGKFEPDFVFNNYSEIRKYLNLIEK